METLRDRPGSRPGLGRGSGLDEVDQEVSIVPTPAPNSSSPGIHRQMPACAPTRTSSKIMPIAVVGAGDDQPPLGVPPGEPARGGRGRQDPDRRRGEPGRSGRAVWSTSSEVHRDVEEGSLQVSHWTFSVPSPSWRPCCGIAERQQRILALLAGPDVQEEPSRNSAPMATTATPGNRALRDHYRAADDEVLRDCQTVGPRLQQPKHPEEQACRGRTARVRSNRRFGPNRAGSVILRASQMIHATTRTCRPNEARQLIAFAPARRSAARRRRPVRRHR